MPYILNQRCHWDLVLVACWDSTARIQATCFICWVVKNVLASTQSHDVQPAYLQTALWFIIKLSLDEMLLLSPGRWDCRGRAGPQATQTTQTVGVQGFRGHWDLPSQWSGASQCLSFQIMFQNESTVTETTPYLPFTLVIRFTL